MAVTEPLPDRFIPEQCRVAVVGSDVINVSGLSKNVLSLALDTEREPVQVVAAGTLPRSCEVHSAMRASSG